MYFQKGQRRQLFGDENVDQGPGTYGIPEKRKVNASFSFGRESRFKQFDPEKFYTPGPDSYKLPSYTCTAPRYLFKTKKIKSNT